MTLDKQLAFKIKRLKIKVTICSNVLTESVIAAGLNAVK